MTNPKFTPEEISVIDSHLGAIVFDWAKSLINHVLTIAREQGVQVVYMNTPKTLAKNAPVSNDMKAEYFYNKLPPLLGFSLEKAKLRGSKKEQFWAYRFKIINADQYHDLMKIAEKQLTLEQLPSKYQGAFLGIIGRKSLYNQDDIDKVLQILKQKQPKNKSQSLFYYDWDSSKWSGGQLFDPNISETVVLQRLSPELLQKYSSNPALYKFFIYLLQQSKHFSNDEIGFALVSKISPQVWLINEVQTDCINHYMDIRGQYYKRDKKEEDKERGVEWDTLKDMLQGRNRSKWIEKLEGDEQFKQKIMANPSMADQLPDDTQDIDKWLREHKTQELGQQLAMTNFKTRIFRCY